MMRNDDLQIQSGELKPEKTTEHIVAEGDIKIRVIVLIVVGAILIILTGGGIVGTIFAPESFKDYWPRVLPIISGAIFGLIGFIVGTTIAPSKGA